MMVILVMMIKNGGDDGDIGDDDDNGDDGDIGDDDKKWR